MGLETRLSTQRGGGRRREGCGTVAMATTGMCRLDRVGSSMRRKKQTHTGIVMQPERKERIARNETKMEQRNWPRAKLICWDSKNYLARLASAVKIL